MGIDRAGRMGIDRCATWITRVALRFVSEVPHTHLVADDAPYLLSEVRGVVHLHRSAVFALQPSPYLGLL